MTPAVIACALALLGRSQTIAPVHLVAVPPPHASSNVEAFVTAGERAIYLVTSSPVRGCAARAVDQRTRRRVPQDGGHPVH